MNPDPDRAGAPRPDGTIAPGEPGAGNLLLIGLALGLGLCVIVQALAAVFGAR